MRSRCGAGGPAVLRSPHACRLHSRPRPNRHSPRAAHPARPLDRQRCAANPCAFSRSWPSRWAPTSVWMRYAACASCSPTTMNRPSRRPCRVSREPCFCLRLRRLLQPAAASAACLRRRAAGLGAAAAGEARPTGCGARRGGARGVQLALDLVLLWSAPWVGLLSAAPMRAVLRSPMGARQRSSTVTAQLASLSHRGRPAGRLGALRTSSSGSPCCAIAHTAAPCAAAPVAPPIPRAPCPAGGARAARTARDPRVAAAARAAPAPPPAPQLAPCPCWWRRCSRRR